MKVLRLTDAALQKIIGDGLRKRLRKAGFAMGASNAEEPNAFLLPINLDLAGHVLCWRDDAEGVFVFQQEDGDITARIDDSHAMHSAAIENRHLPNQGEIE